MDFISDDYENKKEEREKYLKDLHTIIIKSNIPLEGNCFYKHNTLELFSNLYTKQLNLFWCGKQPKTTICEIGFNAGHSTMLMLLGREKSPLTYTIFDIGMHSYTVPCFEYMKSQFPNILFEYIEGDSTITMPNWINKNNNLIGTYDLVHVDGGHSEHCIANDMINADKLLRVGGIMIIDDTNDEIINDYVSKYVKSGKYKDMLLLETFIYPHRIIRKFA
jgi:hypothetical protein